MRRTPRPPGRPARRDDDEVSHMRAIDRVVEPETLGNLLIGRVLEHAFAAADEHRRVGDADMNRSSSTSVSRSRSTSMYVYG